MKADIKERWVSALRSGEYVQGIGGLAQPPTDNNDYTKYCCLGVLCDLAVKDGEPVEVTTHDDFVEYDGAGGLPPARVVSWAGTSSMDPSIPHGRTPQEEATGRAALNSTLSVLNDSGFTFGQIADVIDYFIEEER